MTSINQNDIEYSYVFIDVKTNIVDENIPLIYRNLPGFLSKYQDYLDKYVGLNYNKTKVEFDEELLIAKNELQQAKEKQKPKSIIQAKEKEVKSIQEKIKGLKNLTKIEICDSAELKEG